MIEQFDTVVSYKCEPELIFSAVTNSTNKGDSDVQNRTNQIKAIEELRQQQQQQVKPNKMKSLAMKLKNKKLKQKYL